MMYSPSANVNRKTMIKHGIDWLSHKCLDKPKWCYNAGYSISLHALCCSQRETEAFQSFTLQSCKTNFWDDKVLDLKKLWIQRNQFSPNGFLSKLRHGSKRNIMIRQWIWEYPFLVLWSSRQSPPGLRNHSGPFTDVSLSADEGLSKNRGCPKLWQVANRDQDDKLINHQISGYPLFRKTPHSFSGMSLGSARGHEDRKTCHWRRVGAEAQTLDATPMSGANLRASHGKNGKHWDCARVVSHILSKSPPKK
jgi:hypothetical protein